MPVDSALTDLQGVNAAQVSGAIANLEQLILSLAPDDPELPGLRIQFHHVMGIMLWTERAPSENASTSRKGIPAHDGQGEHGAWCPVCAGPLRQTRTGRPAHYCTTICRQKAHRDRHRAGRIAARLTREREGFSDTVALLPPLIAQLQAINQRAQEQLADLRSPGKFVATGWESEVDVVAQQAQRHLANLTATARKHRAGVEDLRRARAAEQQPAS
ncbi:hypothetical protein ETD86_11595 [Nonomuraea turkmeniaca]|uniref:Uncharacterized protein n=1 Tax=Nonomuraea turkmeniaca TaxID=103838 RepID=A0A5S4FP61_9ACTN|nr:hypothetical protein [Nonomuraea turkmeniaca]TMR22482.1 hypothetical protein ETD86_11595 [Nonomuraea turkmeniaca]